MAEYIERQAAQDVLCDACGNAACPRGLIPRCSYYERMQDIPPADVRPVVRGRWEIQSCGMGGENVFCSVCKCGSGRPYWPFCPMCGADMRGEVND